jgi:hypothetical protein
MKKSHLLSTGKTTKNLIENLIPALSKHFTENSVLAGLGESGI